MPPSSSTSSSTGAPSGSYGIDAPPIVATFVVLALFGAVVAVYSIAEGAPAGAIGPLIAVVLFGGTAALMIRSSKVGKIRTWVRLLDDLDLHGTESVLDLGCGRGLVTAMAAQRVPEGSVTGIDIWRSRDQTGNSRAAAEANMVAAGVEDRVDIVDANMIELPYGDDSFDVVLASLAINNLAHPKDRVKALDELIRVLAPGGKVVILDISKTNIYADHLEAAKLVDVDRSSLSFAIYPPARTVTARRKGGGDSSKPPGWNKEK